MIKHSKLSMKVLPPKLRHSYNNI